MFKRVHHLRIASILADLDSDLLNRTGCYFGGGTAIVLLRDEFRESLDIDFMVSNLEGYRLLRSHLTSSKGLASILLPRSNLQAVREIRADQYGIRTFVQIAESQIKFEIVFEGRIQFDCPGSDDQICGVTRLTVSDLVASKILANSDRWADDSVFNRDLIDLALLNPAKDQLMRGLDKAYLAYGESALRDLRKAIEKLNTRPLRLNECMASLKIDQFPPVLVWNHIRSLEKKLKAFLPPN